MKKSIVKDTLEVAFSNFVILLGNIFTGFIIPMMLGATDYGYYKIFILYSTYTALLHFGFVDGVLILDGGKQYNQLNVKQARTNSQFFIGFQFIISLLLISCAIFINSYFYKLLLITLGVYTFFMNVMTYYQFISQAIMQFKRLSFAQIMQTVLNIVLIMLLYLSYKLNLIHKPSFLPCILILIFVMICLCAWYMYTYRYITFGNCNNFINTYKVIFKYFKAGIYITISYQVSMLLINLDNQFVSWFFAAYVYGIYAFAYSLISVINTLLSSISAVLLPHLKQKSINKMIKIYPSIMSYILLIIFFLFVGYFPLELIIKLFLYKYVKSLIYFRILLPGIAISCCLSLVVFTYFNALNQSRKYFIISLIMLIISICSYSLLYVLFRSVISLAFGSLIVLGIWLGISESVLIKNYGVKWENTTIYMIIMIITFYISSLCYNFIIGAIIYFMFYCIISCFMLRSSVKYIYRCAVTKLINYL